ncbi:MAG TPA: class I SAM-dependent methyltransferase [Dehalococcoidia bacterium]|nr:class I SAM-dependent methyltransferase [Dehalococcoidia bacterium]
MTSQHGYRGLVAEAYDLHPPPYDDHAFYRERIEAADGPALEIGSGTGRLLIPYLQASLHVEGVEPSDEMLAICHEKAAAADVVATVHQQYAQELNLPGRYATIYIPVSSFQLIDSLEDARTALVRFHQHLAPGGQLLISLFIPQEELDSNNEWRLGRRLPREDGSIILISHATRVHHDRQVFRTTSKYELFDREGLLQRTELHSSSLRWYERAQFHTMLEVAGYREIASTGEVAGGTGPDRLMMFRAVR